MDMARPQGYKTGEGLLTGIDEKDFDPKNPNLDYLSHLEIRVKEKLTPFIADIASDGETASLATICVCLLENFNTALDSIDAEWSTITASPVGELCRFLWPHACSVILNPTPETIFVLRETLHECFKRFHAAATAISPPVNSSTVQITVPRQGTKKKINKSDNDGFVQPKKVARQILLTEVTPTKTDNSFEPIAPNHFEDEDGMHIADDDNDDPIPVRAPKVEPIFLKYGANWRKIVDSINKLIGDKLTLKNMGDFVKIFPKTIEQFRIIESELIKNEIKFYAMQPKAERPRKIVIRGLPIDIPCEEIKHELTERGFQIQRLTQLRRFDKVKQQRINLPLFLVNLYVSDNFVEIYDIGELLGFIVKIERFKNKSARQCYNCQRFHHSSEVCHLEPRCLKCAGSHKTTECKKPKTEPAKCANCGEPHPANYTGCRLHPKQLKARREENKTIGQFAKNDIKFSEMPKIISNSSSTDSVPKSYSDALRFKSSKTPSTSNTDDLQSLDDTINKLTQISKLLDKIEAQCKRMQLDPKMFLGNFFNSQKDCTKSLLSAQP